jgi:hypothetical protein
MLGFLMLLPTVGFFAVLGVYMGAFGAFFVAVATAMGIYMAGMASFFTAFFIIMFG